MPDEPNVKGLEDELKIPAPETLAPSIEKARSRTMRRAHAPFMDMRIGDDGEAVWEWPFDDKDQAWKFLILDAFGTRHGNIATVFVNQLLALCSSGNWSEQHQRWYPDDVELTAMMSIVAAYRPKNEAQAALAAQIAATHMLTMKIAKRVSDYPYDTRMISAYAKLARTSAAQAEAMMAIKGKRRTSTQAITVTHEKHIHHHQHVHVEGGASINESQPYDAMDGRPVENGRCATLLGPDPRGIVVPIGGTEGQAPVPSSRRKRVGSAKR